MILQTSREREVFEHGMRDVEEGEEKEDKAELYLGQLESQS